MEMQKTKAYTVSIEVFGEEDEVYNDIRIETDDVALFISQVLSNGFILTNEDGSLLGLSPAMIARVFVEPDEKDQLYFNGYHSVN